KANFCPRIDDQSSGRSETIQRRIYTPIWSAMTYVIETRQLVKYYDDGVRVPALRGVDLRVEPGTFVAIMGPSGSGKSTLLNILGCMESPSEGSLLLEGTEVGTLTDKERTLLRRRRIGFVFQQFNLLPVFSAVENVAMP